MSVNIKGLTAAITDSGVLRNNLYTAKIELPRILMSPRSSTSFLQQAGFGGGFGEESNTLIPRIDRVTLPSRQIRGIMQKSSYRELRMIPTSYQNLEDLSMSIILSSDMRERKMMLAWQNAIFNTDGIPSYVDDISGTIKVMTHGTVNGKEPDKRDWTLHKFEGVFPMMVSDIELSAADEESARLTVIFQYRIWTMPDSKLEGSQGF